MSEQPTKTEGQEEATYDHIIKYTGLFGGVQGLTMLVGIIRNKLTATLLGPSGLALINIYNNVLKLLNNSTNFGISFSAVRNVSELFDEGDTKKISNFVDTVRTWSLMTAVFGMIICCTISPLLSQWTFKNYEYTAIFCAISPIVAMMSITGGEIAILKGLRQLKRVALISVFGAISTLTLSTPLYIWMGIKGIVPALLLSNLAVTCIHLHYSTKTYPWHATWRSMNNIKKGVPMIKLGIAFIIAGVFGQGAELLIRIALLDLGGLEDVGLYNSGYVMAVTYASVVFVAIEADYFPRLSASCSDKTKMNVTINRQIEACVLLISPFLTIFVMAMPLIVQILYTDKFTPAIPMATCATLYMYFKSLTLPAAYLPLANGDSKMYLITELIYDVFIAAAIPIGYKIAGLTGAGIALSAGGLVDLLVIHLTYRWKYGFRFNLKPMFLYSTQLALLVGCIVASFTENTMAKWGTGGICILISATISMRTLNKEMNIIGKIMNKIKKNKDDAGK